MEITHQQKATQKHTSFSRSSDRNAALSYPSRTIVHTKLEMTEPGDHDEQEADAAADEMVSDGKIRRQISNGGGSGIAVSPQMERQIAQLQGGGHAMPDGLRNMMENGFGRDFSQVRLHTDSQAADMSSSISARAFTHCNDIYFNQGQYSPNTSEGQRLVAHELTHVEQGSGKVGRSDVSTIGTMPQQENTDDGMTAAEFTSLLIQFKNLVCTLFAFHDAAVAQKIATTSEKLLGNLISQIDVYELDEAIKEAVQAKKLAQAGQGAARAVDALMKGVNVGIWVFSSAMDIKRALDNRNNTAGCVYYSIRALATIADCPFAPWPPTAKALLLTFNTASGLGDVYAETDNAVIHPYRRAETVGNFYGGADSVGGCIGFGLASIPLLGEVGEGLGYGLGWTVSKIGSLFD